MDSCCKHSEGKQGTSCLLFGLGAQDKCLGGKKGNLIQVQEVSLSFAWSHTDTNWCGLYQQNTPFLLQIALIKSERTKDQACRMLVLEGILIQEIVC